MIAFPFLFMRLNDQMVVKQIPYQVASQNVLCLGLCFNELSCSRGDFMLANLTATYAKSGSRLNPSCCTEEDHPHHAVREQTIPTVLYRSRPYPPHQQHAIDVVAGGSQLGRSQSSQAQCATSALASLTQPDHKD